MKLCTETLRRVVNYHRHAKKFLLMQSKETRYAWRNVLRANRPARSMPLPHVISTVRALQSSPEHGYDAATVERILLEGNSALEQEGPDGPLGYGRMNPYGDDFRSDRRRINVARTLAAAETTEEKANLAYLLAETTRISRFIIDRRSTLGYYRIRPPRLSSEALHTALGFLEETRQLEKGIRLAERMQQYGVAARMARMEEYAGQEHWRFQVQLLYLDGQTDQAIELSLRKGDAWETKAWLQSNLELELAEKISTT